VKHDTTTSGGKAKVEQVCIKNKCGHSVLLDTLICWTKWIFPY